MSDAIRKPAPESQAAATPAAARSTAQAAGLDDRRATAAAGRRLADDVTHGPRMVAQRRLADAVAASPRMQAASRGGLPAQLKSGVEKLAGMSMDHVRVHYNSSKPAQLNAHAYTQGSDIHVAPGQQRHLPHEAWHVVQQAQGRVRPTRQLKGRTALNDDAGLEREADAMGARAMQLRSAADGQPPQAMGKGGSVVQRAIGYEVELGTMSVQPDPNAATPPALSKGLVLWRGSGWDVSVDDLPGHGFDLELRTDPIDDLAAGGRAKAAGRLRDIAALWRRMEAQGQTCPASFYRSGASPHILIDSAHSPHFAQLQASAGLSLDALHAIRSGAALAAMTGPHAGYLGQGGVAHPGVWGQVTARLANLRAALGLAPTENIDNLATIVAMIVEVPANSWNVPSPYPKGFAGGLLARTNFATILRQLPPNQAQAIESHATAWRAELMAITGLVLAGGAHAPAAVNRNTPVFRPGSTPAAGAFAGRLKLGDWYRDLAHGADRLTADDYRARHPNRPEADELESLGSYGSKMDAGSYQLRVGAAMEAASGAAMMVVGAVASVAQIDGAGATGAAVGGTGAGLALHGLHNIATPQRNRPIFEFRSMLQPDVDNLVNAGLELWDYVDEAHGRRPGGPNQISMAKRLWNWLGSK
jgi:hypothetical protein